MKLSMKNDGILTLVEGSKPVEHQNPAIVQTPKPSDGPDSKAKERSSLTTMVVEQVVSALHTDCSGAVGSR